MGKGMRSKDIYIILLGIYIVVFFFAVALAMAETLNGSEEEGVDNRKREEGKMEKTACCDVSVDDEYSSLYHHKQAFQAKFGAKGNGLIMSCPCRKWNIISENWEFLDRCKDINTADKYESATLSRTYFSLADGYIAMFGGDHDEWGESSNNLRDSPLRNGGNSKKLPKILRWVGHAFRWIRR